ncbi:hypothetical protein HJG60_011292 [Phyllostomus discolor]|uniref:Uncharacterized protein n=1 Tax=Phyllostomus discolor TaxID=89673 RepID=A0A834E1M8_9CHIR|nr:hypothetical protein HJG60_011292 [Phyllostomus discolor]
MGRTQVRLSLAYTTQKTPEPVHLVDSYRPHWSTTTLPHIADPPQRAEVSGQQPVLAADWLRYLSPIDYQEQSRLNYKRRVYSAHTKGTSQVLSLGDRRGCATGVYRTPTTLGHTTKTGSHSSST